MALRKPSFIWNRKRVVIAELLLCSDAPRTAASVARALRLQHVKVLASLERMEKEGFLEANRSYNPDQLLGIERTFAVAPDKCTYVQKRVDRFRKWHPLRQWYVEIEIPTAPLSAEEEETLRRAMPRLIRFKQPRGEWLIVVMKVATEHQYDAFDTAYDEFVEAWEHTLERDSLPNFGVSHTVPWDHSTE